MSNHVLARLQAKHRDLLARSRYLRACGFIASANALLERAWRCVEQIHAAEYHALVMRESQEGRANHAC
jgi:hypothetical protein